MASEKKPAQPDEYEEAIEELRDDEAELAAEQREIADDRKFVAERLTSKHDGEEAW